MWSVNAVWDRRRATAGLSNGQCFGLACKGAGRRSPLGVAGGRLLCLSFHLFACNFFVWCPNWTIYDSMKSRWCVLLDFFVFSMCQWLDLCCTAFMYVALRLSMVIACKESRDCIDLVMILLSCVWDAVRVPHRLNIRKQTPSST